MPTDVKQVNSAGSAATITLASLANAAGRVSDQIDLGAAHAAQVRVRYKVKFASAPTAGLRVELYMATSDNTLRDGTVGAVDAALTAARRFQLTAIGHHYCTNDANQQESSFVVPVGSRYISIAVYNASGQAFTGTAGDHAVSVEQITDQIQ